ncbi:unnamed protein product [Prorocentrum cordatum]|uniref:Uncharacterized protein n=1 Tax=Prorocentrum cordatum TaxID=2364126 RepID=A0ABN9VUA4_9DINO|nr:unnamed protein product [Polarella glacialis]
MARREGAAEVTARLAGGPEVLAARAATPPERPHSQRRGSRQSANTAEGSLFSGTESGLAESAAAPDALPPAGQSAAAVRSSEDGAAVAEPFSSELAPLNINFSAATIKAPSVSLANVMPAPKVLDEEEQARLNAKLKAAAKGSAKSRGRIRGKQRRQPGKAAAAGEEEDAGAQKFIEVEFAVGESPLGIRLDWSMALPVIVDILPEYPASFRYDLQSGLVLVGSAMDREIRPGDSVMVTTDLSKMLQLFEASGCTWHEAMEGIMGTEQKVLEVRERGRIIGLTEVTRDSGQQVWFYPAGCFTLLSLIPPGEPRERVEERLSVRPLVLFFEAPDWARLEENLEAQKQRSVATPLKSAPPHGDSALRKAGMSQMLYAPGGRHDLFSLNPERAPLTRFNTRLEPALSTATSLPQLVRSTSETSLLLHSGSIDAGTRTHFAPQSAAQTLSPWQVQSSGAGWRSRAGAATPPGSGYDSPALALSGSLATGAPLRSHEPDPCYEEVIRRAPERQYGPGPPSRWAQRHATQHTCRLTDLALARRMRDAYEVGFRAFKYRDPPGKQWETGDVGGPLKRVVLSDGADLATCDVCGVALASAASPPEAVQFFYFCRKCKKHGHRFEVCLMCHATEVLQAEGKHAARSLHPHWLRCEHHAMIRFGGASVGYVGFPQLQRAFCDYCGKLVKEEGDKNLLYVCTRCPKEENGLRFELCHSCAVSLSEFGKGIRRLFSNI